MAMRVGSSMSVNSALCYLRERLFKVHIGLLWIWLLACVLTTATEPLGQIVWLTISSLLLLATFRLWDDLEDVEYDRRRFPQRCLVRMADRRAVYATLVLLILLLTTLLSWFVSVERGVAFLIFVALFAVMYRVTGNNGAALRQLRITMVLMKYPAFVLLLAAHPGERMVLLAAISACLPPLLHEVRSSGIKTLLFAVIFMGIPATAWLFLIT